MVDAVAAHDAPQDGSAVGNRIRRQWERPPAELIELMAATAAARGITGLVIDGAVRDVTRLESLRFAVFGRGICPAGPSKEGTGEIGYPVACGGVVCSAGDLVIGDADGVVIIPRADLGPVLDKVRAISQEEDRLRAGLAQGQPLLVAAAGSPT